MTDVQTYKHLTVGKTYWTSDQLNRLAQVKIATIRDAGHYAGTTVTLCVSSGHESLDRFTKFDDELYVKRSDACAHVLRGIEAEMDRLHDRKQEAEEAASEEDYRENEIMLDTRTDMDGDKWCCVGSDFINLQESVAGFGDTEDEAKESYLIAKLTEVAP